mmetsp:Transcript_23405/g.51712  ORF Transcript_23405/g.51712 Transcript_23405/m.51712 type:complete len:85 (+) Transcript_23405:294-548(+)
MTAKKPPFSCGSCKFPRPLPLLLDWAARSLICLLRDVYPSLEGQGLGAGWLQAWQMLKKLKALRQGFKDSRPSCWPRRPGGDQN